jgi:hypothetical protein
LQTSNLQPHLRSNNEENSFRIRLPPGENALGGIAALASVLLEKP